MLSCLGVFILKWLSLGLLVPCSRTGLVAGLVPKVKQALLLLAQQIPSSLSQVSLGHDKCTRSLHAVFS